MGKEMTRTYSAADFANARFAEHELGLLAIRSDPDDIEKPWADGGGNWHSDQAMARDGWVPVPTKPTITESRFMELVEVCSFADGPASYREFCRLTGIEIIPDSEPTNTERLTEMHKDWLCLANPESETFPEYLNRKGVTAPNVKGN